MAVQVLCNFNVVWSKLPPWHLSHFVFYSRVTIDSSKLKPKYVNRLDVHVRDELLIFTSEALPDPKGFVFPPGIKFILMTQNVYFKQSNRNKAKKHHHQSNGPFNAWSEDAFMGLSGLFIPTIKSRFWHHFCLLQVWIISRMYNYGKIKLRWLALFICIIFVCWRSQFVFYFNMFSEQNPLKTEL